MKITTFITIIVVLMLNVICLLLLLLWIGFGKTHSDSNRDSGDGEYEDNQFGKIPSTAENYEKHPCHWNRVCSSDVNSRLTCGYKFVLTHHLVMSKHCRHCPNDTTHCFLPGCLAEDGVQRVVSLVNGMQPGPSIRVCQGDTIVVDVTNNLIGQDTSIHWHGIHLKNRIFLDGVPSLTQCSIRPGNTFRYEFEVPIAGTHFWHSHEGFQRTDIFGSLIVRPPEEQGGVQNGSKILYDFDLTEHELIIWDLLPRPGVSSFVHGQNGMDRDFPSNILINGKGFPHGFFDDFLPHEIVQIKGKPFVPLEEIRIGKNLAYRVRLISNGITECPIELSIENHTLEVIASDGFDIMPLTVESIVLFAGERWDFILRGSQPAGSYWVKLRGLGDCDSRYKSVFQLAVLNYEEIPGGTLPPHSIKNWNHSAPTGNVQNGLQLNPLTIAPGIPGKFVTVAELSSAIPDEDEDDDPEIIRRDKADHQFYITYDFNPVPSPIYENIVNYLPQLNFITHAFPHAPPLSQPETMDSIHKCNEETMTNDLSGVNNCTIQFCHCSHWLKVDLDSIVEIVLIDRGSFDAVHPFHLHGHAFRVVAMERLGDTTETSIVKERDAQGLINRRRSKAPIKDTVNVVDGGYTIIRFRANNPGFWLFHCHIETHASEGMALIIQVGELDQMPKPPKNFPKCSDYLPPPTLSSRPISTI